MPTVLLGMAWESVVLAGLAGADAFALYKYVESSRKVREQTASKPATASTPPSYPASSDSATIAGSLSSRLEAIKAAVGEMKAEGGEGDGAEPAISLEDTEVLESGTKTASSLELPASASADDKMSFILSSLEENAEAVRRLNADFSSIEDRVAALERKYAKTHGGASAEIKIPLVKRGKAAGAAG